MTTTKLVTSWNRKVLRAASTLSQVCETAESGGTDCFVGMNLLASDGTVFAHCHWQAEDAEKVAMHIIECARWIRRQRGEAVSTQ